MFLQVTQSMRMVKVNLASTTKAQLLYKMRYRNTEYMQVIKSRT